MAILNATPLVATIPGSHQFNLWLHGPTVEVELAVPVVPQVGGVSITASGPTIGGHALIDTGAFGTVIDDATAKKLGLIATGTSQSRGVFGDPQTVAEYAVAWKLASSSRYDTIAVTEAPLIANMNIIMIIGRNILANCVLTYNGVMGTFTLAW